MKIISFVWLLSILTFLVAVVRTGASKDKDAELRCYNCTHADNTTECNPLEISPVRCSPNMPYCGTTATSPSFISSLVCTTERQTPCTLIETANATYEIICACKNDLCNRPFTREFQNELLNFSFTNLRNNTARELLEVFINSSVYANITVSNLYTAITLASEENAKNTSVPTISPNLLVPNVSNDENIPRAEALKHDATAPSDDDEDEGEGSGSFEDVKPQAPAAPAAPSSFLPANENKAIPVNLNILATIPFLFLCSVV